MAANKHENRRELYDKLSRQIDDTTAGGLTKPRAGLLLWFFSVVKGYDEADAFEFICDGDDDGGIDGLLMETYETTDGPRYLLMAFQSKYPEKPSMIGRTEVSQFIGDGHRLEQIEDLRLLVESPRRQELRRLVDRFRLEEKIDAGVVTFRLQFVTAGYLGTEAKKTVEAKNRALPGYVKSWDIDVLGPAIEAFNAPTPVVAEVTVPVENDEMMVVKANDYRAAVAAVRATDIVKWPGIEDRTLFNLNVRRQLPLNRVRKALDLATSHRAGHHRFLAAHNGITVICEQLETSDGKMVMHNPSVVNGAQSVIAFFENGTILSDSLRVFVKVCELDPASPFARDIAIRSNTQSAINSRNLRALDGPQLRIQDEFEDRFSHITYETRPDASLTPTESIIHNHQAGKCLCAVMSRRPWLAVRSLSLFDEPHYADIFNDEIHADQVLLSVALKQMVDEDRKNYPDTYQRAWVLTSIIATYLAAEALRVVRGDDDLVTFAVAYVSDPVDHLLATKTARNVARKTLEVRHDRKQQRQEFDDFKVDFKNEQTLRDLGEKAREFAIVLKD